jgi:hypothetical protein
MDVAFAQQANQNAAEKYLGVNFGYGFSGIMFQPRFGQEIYPQSYSGGLTFKYKGEKYMAFQGDVLYSLRGYRTKTDTSTYERTNSSIMVPMMAQGVVGYKWFNVIAGLGCYGSYILNSKEKTTIHNVTTSKDYDFLLARDHRYEFGVVANAGFSFNMNPVMLQLEARYYYGLTNLLVPNYQGSKLFDSRQYQLQISAGLYLNLGSVLGNTPKQTKK